jgi:D-alanyl-D-alanine carboxypeptidase/D-alanyl-D-alanine-endopeptidase (penicillin-binding protein 4)
LVLQLYLSISVMKKIILFLPILILGIAATTSDYLNTWLSDEMLHPATVSLAVYDLDSNEYVLQHNSQKVLPAASVQKLITTTIALKTLGSDHQFETILAYTGDIKDGILRGDIYIFPNFNPTLANKRFGKNISEITGAIKSWLAKNNVKVIAGIKVVDPTMKSETLPRTWIWEDIGNYYGANPCGTVLNENILELYFESGAAGEPTKIVKTIPDLPLLRVTNRVLSSEKNRDLAYAFGGPYERGLVVEGTIPANRKNFKVKAALQNPQKALAYLVYEELKKSPFLTIKGKYGTLEKNKRPYKQFGVVKSASVNEIVKKTNHKSVNILAENLLQNSHMHSGSQRSMGIWAKDYLANKLNISVAGMQLKDGSGLSRFNAISSQQLVELLIVMKDNKAFQNSLPTARKSGTVKSFLKNSSLNVRCKSGSMQGVRSYAGYMSTNSGRKFAFSIIINNAEVKGSNVKKKIEELLIHVGGL